MKNPGTANRAGLTCRLRSTRGNVQKQGKENRKKTPSVNMLKKKRKLQPLSRVRERGGKELSLSTEMDIEKRPAGGEHTGAPLRLGGAGNKASGGSCSDEGKCQNGGGRKEHVTRSSPKGRGATLAGPGGRHGLTNSKNQKNGGEKNRTRKCWINTSKPK